MSDIALIGLQGALVALVLMLLPIAYRIFTGPGQPERLQALDTFAALLIGALVVLSVLQQTSMMVDVALALAAFSFIATVGIARYMAQGKVF